MNFGWIDRSAWAAVVAIFRKEWRCELRARHGFLTSILFGVITVVAIAFAIANQRPSPTVYAGLLSVVLLFAATLTLPRIFLVEDEQRTLDWLRLMGRPEAAFLGKSLYALLQMALVTFFLTTLFVVLTGVQIRDVGLFLAALMVGTLAWTTTICVTGLLVVGASNRWTLGTVVALPLLLPEVALSVGALRASLGEGSLSGGWQNVAGIGLFAVAMFAFGPTLAQAMWGLDRRTR